MSQISMCLPFVKNALIKNPKIPMCDLLQFVNSDVKVGKNSLRKAIQICIDAKAIEIIYSIRGRRTAYKWADNAIIPNVDQKINVEFYADTKYDYPCQNIVKAEICKPAKFTYNPLDIMLHMWATLPSNEQSVA